jgi:hypothetical protein
VAGYDGLNGYEVLKKLPEPKLPAGATLNEFAITLNF